MFIDIIDITVVCVELKEMVKYSTYCQPSCLKYICVRHQRVGFLSYSDFDNNKWNLLRLSCGLINFALTF